MRSLWGLYPTRLDGCDCKREVAERRSLYVAATATHQEAVSARRAAERIRLSTPTKSVERGQATAQLAQVEAAAKAAWNASEKARRAWRERQGQGHSCPGRCRYFVIDLDAHHGENDMSTMIVAVLSTARQLRLHPVVFESKSGSGAHIFFFLDDDVTSTEAHAAGCELARRAGIPPDRRDVIPSAEHPKGYGTLHVLPLSPLTRPPLVSAPGGRLLDEWARRGLHANELVQRLREADRDRSPAVVVRRLVSEAPRPDAPALPPPISPGRRPRKTGPTRTHAETPINSAKVEPLDAKDEEVWSLLQEEHQDLADELRLDPRGQWGGRSRRDAKLVGFLRRQGLSPDGITYLMLRSINGTKSRDRGLKYVAKLVADQEKKAQAIERQLASTALGGTPLPRRGVSTCTTQWYPGERRGYGGGEAPALGRVLEQFQRDERLLPLRSLGAYSNPFYRSDVLRRLAACKTPAAAYVLAYLGDRWHVGKFDRRFYVSYRMLEAALRLKRGTLQRAVKWIESELPDIVCVKRGVPHATLRLANSYEFLV